MHNKVLKISEKYQCFFFNLGRWCKAPQKVPWSCHFIWFKFLCAHMWNWLQHFWTKHRFPNAVVSFMNTCIHPPLYIWRVRIIFTLHRWCTRVVPEGPTSTCCGCAWMSIPRPEHWILFNSFAEIKLAPRKRNVQGFHWPLFYSQR